MKYHVKLFDSKTLDYRLICNMATGNIKWWATKENAQMFCNRFNHRLKQGKKLIVVRGDGDVRDKE